MGGDGQWWLPAFVALNEIQMRIMLLEMTFNQDEKDVQLTDNN